MKTDTREKILKLLKKNKQLKVHDLIQELDLSAVAIHKQLKKLLLDKKIKKIGKSPLVYYQLLELEKNIIPKLSENINKVINKNYLYITADGQVLSGVEGFFYWTKSIKEQNRFSQLASEYVEQINQVNFDYKKNDLINATKKFKDTFDKIFLDKVYYQDFYSLPKFGKTKLGQLVLHAKQSQQRTLIAQVVKEIKINLNLLIKKEKIEAIGFIPHSIPRKISFLKEVSNLLDLDLPRINLIKIYAGEVLVAQKTLPKLNSRIENAKKTILVNEKKINYNNILLIDDAVGSGSTLNEVASKLRTGFQVKKIIGYAIVGSIKGFEVISEV